MVGIFGEIGTQWPVLLDVVVVVVVVLLITIIYQMLDCRGVGAAHVFQIVNFGKEKTRKNHTFALLLHTS